MPIVFAAISPHPPIILPTVGSVDDRARVRNTILALEKLGRGLKEKDPKEIIVSAPHSDWGFNVPLFFLAKDFTKENKINTYSIGLETPEFYFDEGKSVYKTVIEKSGLNFAIIASGDLSHCLKEDGPYGFNPDGPKFDRDLIEALEKKDIEMIFKLDDIYPGAGECGLRSFCFMLGILGAAGIDWKAEVLSYEGPFGVGYLVDDFKF
jgi:aromatic ring-opening dioxygenase LigB subunit